MSTFDGFIQEINWISVDKFEHENSELCTTFFLSHCHTDHMNGLNRPDFLKGKTNHYLYCSEITALILRNLGFHHLKNNIRTLEICCPTVISIPQFDGEGSSQDVMVTLLPAGHCPGSTMILFETSHETILYTGDFRICDKDIAKFQPLHHKDGLPKEINKLYIDTTFWNLPQEHFPSRDESLLLITSEIEKWISKNADGQIHIDRPARIGSEFLAVALSQKFKSKIHISSESCQLYKGITEVEDSVTLDSSTRLHMCQKFGPRRHGRTLKCSSSYLPVLYIRPTAQWYATGDAFLPFRFDKKNSFLQISLSMHASRLELISILRYLKPKNVYACVVPQHMTLNEINEELHAIAHGLACTPSILHRHRVLSYVPPALVSSDDENKLQDDEADQF